MHCVVTEPAAGRMEVREGGGGLTLFGLPFLAAGLFLVFGSLGIVSMQSGGDAPARPALFLLGLTFTLIGALFVFGRRVTSLELGERVATTQWRLLLPVRSRTYQLGDYRAVTIAFVRGDSDSADQYPVGLIARDGPPLVLCHPTAYAQARECAAAIARHVGLDIEDSSTDHSTRVAAGEADAPLQQRLRAAIVTVSTEELRVEQRGIMRMRTVAAFSASEVLDVDFSTKESALASARRNAEAEAATMRNVPATSPAASPAVERVFTVLSAFVKGQGIIVKTRKGLTTFGEGLPDNEIRYLHAVIERALAGGKAA